MSLTFENTTPENVGIDSGAIIDFIDTATERGIAMHSLMILRHGKKAVELYWQPYGCQSQNHVYSFSKTITSMAIGFAVEEGLLSYDDRLCSFFPRYIGSEVDERMYSVTVEHLLTMTSGMVIANEISAAFKNDWVRFFLNSRLSSFPGEKFSYNSLNSYMLAAILRKVSGVGLIEYLTPRLFEPLGISGIYSDKCPMGRDLGGWGIHIRTEDMARLGQLLLQQGRLDDKQLLPSQWFERATRSHTDTRTDTKFPNHEDVQSGYGYQIWINHDKSSFRADGMLGQFALVLPELDCVIVSTAGNMDEYPVLDILWEKLVPAVSSLSDGSDAGKSFDELMHRCADLSIIPTEPTVLSLLTCKFNDTLYTLPVNRQSVFPFFVRYTKRRLLTGIQSFRFSFGSTSNMTWVECNSEITVPLFFDGKFHDTSIPFFGTEIPCSVYAAISEYTPTVFSLEVLLTFTDTPHSRHLFFTLSEDTLSVRFNELPDYGDFARFAGDHISFIRSISPYLSKTAGKIAEITIVAKADAHNESTRSKVPGDDLNVQ